MSKPMLEEKLYENPFEVMEIDKESDLRFIEYLAKDSSFSSYELEPFIKGCGSENKNKNKNKNGKDINYVTLRKMINEDILNNNNNKTSLLIKDDPFIKNIDKISEGVKLSVIPTPQNDNQSFYHSISYYKYSNFDKSDKLKENVYYFAFRECFGFDSIPTEDQLNNYKSSLQNADTNLKIIDQYFYKVYCEQLYKGAPKYEKKGFKAEIEEGDISLCLKLSICFKFITDSDIVFASPTFCIKFMEYMKKRSQKEASVHHLFDSFIVSELFRTKIIIYLFNLEEKKLEQLYIINPCIVANEMIEQFPYLILYHNHFDIMKLDILNKNVSRIKKKR